MQKVSLQSRIYTCTIRSTDLVYDIEFYRYHGCDVVYFFINRTILASNVYIYIYRHLLDMETLIGQIG